MKHLILLAVVLGLGACSSGGGLSKLAERSSAVAVEMNSLAASVGADFTGTVDASIGKKHLRVIAMPNSTVTGEGDGEQKLLSANKGDDENIRSAMFYDNLILGGDVTGGTSGGGEAGVSIEGGSGLALGHSSDLVAMATCLSASGGNAEIAALCRQPAVE